MVKINYLITVHLNIRKTVFWIIDFFKGANVRKHLKDIELVLNNNIKEHSRKELLNRLLNHAINSTKYYENIEFNSLMDFPVVNKKIIRDNYRDFCSTKFKDKTIYEVITSGSTGLPFKILQNKNKKYRNTADTIYYGKKAGFEIGEKLIYLKIWNNVNEKSKIKKLSENIEPINVLNLSNDNLKEIINQLNKFRTLHFLGYTSAIETLCHFIYNYDIKFLFNVKSVITMSESLDEKSRKFISKVLNTNVFSRYSNVENGIIAQQINTSASFHFNRASYYIEILNLDNDLPTPDEKIGRIVITDLYNYAMPIIRYDTGDIGKISYHEDGKLFLKEVEGRKMDVIYNTTGQLLSSFVVTNSMWNYSELVQYQFIQTGEKTYMFKLNIENEFNREEELINEFKEYLGHDATIIIEYVNEIPLLSSGKRKKVMNIWLN